MQIVIVLISIIKIAFKQSYDLSKFSVKIGHLLCNDLILPSHPVVHTHLGILFMRKHI